MGPDLLKVEFMAQQGMTCLPAESSAVNGEIRFMLLSRLVTVIQAPLSTNQHQAASSNAQSGLLRTAWVITSLCLLDKR